MASQTVPCVTEQPTPRGRRFSQVLRVFGDRHFHTDGELLTIAFGTGGTLWSVEEPGVLRQWDTTAGQQLGWAFLSELATAWRFSDDARLVAAGGDQITIWDVASAQLLALLPQPSWVTAMAFAPDNHLLATGHDDGVVRIWDPGSHALVRVHAGHDGAISALAWHADGRLASAAEDRSIRLWDSVGRHSSTLLGHTDRISALAWDPNGSRLASAGWDTTVRLWNADTAEPIILLNAHADQVTALTFHPKGGRLASADSAHTVYLWDTQRHEVVHRWQDHRADVATLAFSADGTRLASGGADRVLHIWDTAAGERLSSRGEATLDCVSLALTEGGCRLISTAGGTGLHVWDTATGQALVENKSSKGWHVLAGSPNGRWFAAGGADTCVRLYEAATAELRATLAGQDGSVAALAFAPNSERLASASATDGMVWLWRVPTGEPCLVIPEAADNCMIETLAFEPAGRLLAVGGIDWLATGGSDGVVGLWDVNEPGPVVTLEGGVTSLAFHPCGRWLAGASLGDLIYIWDLRTFERIERLSGHTASVTSVAFSPDGRWLASGGDDRTVRLWNTVSWEPAAVLELPTQIKALIFSPNSRLLYTGNGNTTSYQLDVARLAQCQPQRTIELDRTRLPLALPGVAKVHD